jgi:hypothetical protein
MKQAALLGLFSALVSACAAGSVTPPAPPASAASADGGDGGNVDLSTVNAFCNARAAAECSDAVISQCVVSDKTSCLTKGAASCMAAVPQGTTYQQGKAQACLDAVTAAYGMGQITAASQATIDQACGPALFSGPGAARSPCSGPYDCSSAQSLTCIIAFPAPTDGMGKCLVPNNVPAGAACSGEADVCADSYYCEPMSKQCVADEAVGQSCSPGYQPCATGLTCPGLGIFGSTCKALPPDGSPCKAGTDCASGLCDKAAAQAQGNCASVITLTQIDSLCLQFQ